MTFDQAAELWIYGCLGIALLFFAFAGGLDDTKNRVTIAFLLLIAIYTVGVVIAALINTGPVIP